MSKKNPDVIKVIQELDIDRRLNMVQTVLNAFNSKSKNDKNTKLNDMEKKQIFEIVGKETDLNDDPIRLCLDYLHDIIQQIHLDLSTINEKIVRHNTKWFNAWRTLNIKPLLENLKLHSNLLDKRFDDLTKISMFLHNINK